MDITSQPNLKPFRDYSEHDVVNLYAHESGNVNKGTWVTILHATGNTNVTQNTGASVTPHVGWNDALSSNTPSRATVLRPEVQWKVKSAESTDTNPLGITLYDVKETNSWGEKYIYQPRYDRAEQQVCVSGEAVPVLTDGLVKLNGFSGVAAPGSGAVVGVTRGELVVTGYTNSTQNVGKFLTSADADGYAIFKVEC